MRVGSAAPPPAGSACGGGGGGGARRRRRWKAERSSSFRMATVKAVLTSTRVSTLSDGVGRLESPMDVGLGDEAVEIRPMEAFASKRDRLRIRWLRTVRSAGKEKKKKTQIQIYLMRSV